MIVLSGRLDTSLALLVGLDALLGSLLDGDLALKNFLDLGLDLAPVLEDGEGNVVSNTELNEI